MEQLDNIITKINMQEMLVVLEQPYLDSVIFISHHNIHSHTGHSKINQAFTSVGITFSSIESRIPGLSVTISDVLAVIYSYHHLILVKIFSLSTTQQASLSQLLYDYYSWSVRYEYNLTFTSTFLTYTYIPILYQKCNRN